MYYKSVIIDKNRILPYFQNKVKNLNKYNNNNNNNNNNNKIGYFHDVKSSNIFEC